MAAGEGVVGEAVSATASSSPQAAATSAKTATNTDKRIRILYRVSELSVVGDGDRTPSRRHRLRSLDGPTTLNQNLATRQA